MSRKVDHRGKLRACGRAWHHNPTPYKFQIAVPHQRQPLRRTLHAAMTPSTPVTVPVVPIRHAPLWRLAGTGPIRFDPIPTTGSCSFLWIPVMQTALENQQRQLTISRLNNTDSRHTSSSILTPADPPNWAGGISISERGVIQLGQAPHANAYPQGQWQSMASWTVCPKTRLNGHDCFVTVCLPRAGRLSRGSKGCCMERPYPCHNSERACNMGRTNKVIGAQESVLTLTSP